VGGIEFDPEKLREVEYIHDPDPRNTMIAWVDTTSGEIRPLQVSDFHGALESLIFGPTVPEEIAQQFETVKNLYLYSWFIYRFQPIAEMQSLACLEYALRTRLEVEIKTGMLNDKRPGLQRLMRYASDNQLLKNEGFARWVHTEDDEWDLLRSLEVVLPKIRNDYAHGIYSLMPTALGIIELVYEIIKQLFSETK
jgi:hypothetical protein